MSYLSRRMREERWPWARPEVDVERDWVEFDIKLAEIAKMADLQLMPWQQHVMRELYIDHHSLPRLVDPPARGPFRRLLADEIAQIFAPTIPEPTPVVTLADEVRAARELEDAPKLPERIKLTAGEWETGKARMPVPPDWGPNRPADWAWGVPVELVDDPEESDLRRRFRRERLEFWAGESEAR